MEANKEKALEAALGQIEKQFGKGTVMRMGEEKREAIPSISTGSLGLDIAWVLADFQRDALLKSMGLNPQVKQR